MKDAVRIDEETNENLNVLKKKLYSPKAQIVKRLVIEEMKKIQKKEAVKA